MARCKYMKVKDAQRVGMGQFPNFSRTGSITGMKRKFYGVDALLVRSGSYIYNVPKSIYDMAY